MSETKQDIFMEATRMKLRFQTVKGLLSTEDLWNLKIADLDALYRTVNGDAGNSNGLMDRSVDKTVQLRLDIIEAIFTAKRDEMKAVQDKKVKAEKRDRIKLLLQKKEEENLSSKSTEELLKELASLED